MKQFQIILFVMLTCLGIAKAQTKTEPWKENQLMDPRFLADQINSGKAGDLLILSVGPDAVIKGSADIGPGKEAGNIAKLKKQLKNVAKEKQVIIYCGCCPFDKCPNVRPAFQALVDLGYKKPMLLNIPKNIKADWLDKNYPVNE